MLQVVSAFPVAANAAVLSKMHQVSVVVVASSASSAAMAARYSGL
jgi:hypothetical protein